MEGRSRKTKVLVEQANKTSSQWNDGEAWTEYGQFWVSITPQYSGREKFVAGEVESIVTHTIRGDYMELKDVTAEMRVVFDPDMDYTTVADSARVFIVLAVMPDIENHQDVVIRVEEEGRRYGELQ